MLENLIRSYGTNHLLAAEVYQQKKVAEKDGKFNDFGLRSSVIQEKQITKKWYMKHLCRSERFLKDGAPQSNIVKILFCFFNDVCCCTYT